MVKNVVCPREVNGEYFFVAHARDNDKVRLGSRVDLTGYHALEICKTRL